jgi:hypothetical protein
MSGLLWLKFCLCGRDAYGESSIAGDKRWAGSYGVNIDFVARSHCAVEIILAEDIQASALQPEGKNSKIENKD